MKPVRFLEPAEMELNEAARYYTMRVAGLGADFLDSIDAAILDIQDDPERCPIVRSEIRRRLVLRFPYALLYRIDSDEIVIEAVMHLHRQPNYWTSR